MCCKSETGKGKRTNDEYTSVIFWVSEKLFLDRKVNKVNSTATKPQPQPLSFVACLVSVLMMKVVTFPLRTIRAVKLKLGNGLSWSSYVFLVLLGLLGLGFVISGIMMATIVEKPLDRTEILNLDYTKTNPVACVPISRVANKQELQLLLSLTMPLSKYNTQLGMFQVKVELVTSSGEVRQNTSKACILELRNKATTLFSTSQILNIKINQLTLDPEPDGAFMMNVVIESRARASSEGCIPQIYGASVSLKSHHLSLLHSLFWNFKFTLFVWTSFFFFFFLLLFLLYAFYLVFPFASPKHL